MTRRATLLVVALGFASAPLCGCESSNVLGGVWRPIAAPEGDLVIGPTAGPEAPGVEVVLGHYGPDISGVVRYYRHDDFALPRDPLKPFDECACAFVHKGRWSESAQRLGFVLKGCMPGPAAREQVYVRGTFTLEAGPPTQLVGSLEVEDPASPLYGRRQTWQLERFDTVSASDLSCEPVSDEGAGNPASGR